MNHRHLELSRQFYYLLCAVFLIQSCLQIFVNIDLQHDGVPYYVGRITDEGYDPHKDFRYIWGPISAWFYSIPFKVSTFQSLLNQRVFFAACEALVTILIFFILKSEFKAKNAFIISMLIQCMNPTTIVSLKSTEVHWSHSFWPNRIATLMMLLALVALIYVNSSVIKAALMGILCCSLPLVRFNFIISSFFIGILYIRYFVLSRNSKIETDKSLRNKELTFATIICALVVAIITRPWFPFFLSDSINPIINPTYENGVPTFSAFGIMKSLLILILAICFFVLILNRTVIFAQPKTIPMILIMVTVLAIIEILTGFSFSHYIKSAILILPLSYMLSLVGHSFLHLKWMYENLNESKIILISSVLSLLPLSHNLNADYIWLNATIPTLVAFLAINKQKRRELHRSSSSMKIAIALVGISTLISMTQFIIADKTRYKSEFFSGLFSTNLETTYKIDTMAETWKTSIKSVQEDGANREDIEFICRNGVIVGATSSPVLMDVFRGNIEQDVSLNNSKIRIYCDVNKNELLALKQRFQEQDFSFQQVRILKDSFFIVVNRR